MNILRAPEAAKKCGFSTVTLWRKSKEDTSFPQPVKISERVTGWLEHEVEAWLVARVAEARRPK